MKFGTTEVTLLASVFFVIVVALAGIVGVVWCAGIVIATSREG